MAGAQCVFADINPAAFNIDTDRIEEHLHGRRRSIGAVPGQPADMAPIKGIAARHGLRVIGDAAGAHGTQYAAADQLSSRISPVSASILAEPRATATPVPW